MGRTCCSAALTELFSGLYYRWRPVWILVIVLLLSSFFILGDRVSLSLYVFSWQGPDSSHGLLEMSGPVHG